MRSGFKLNKMTGADVRIMVQNSQERRFFGTGSLREDYLAGKLRGVSKEVHDAGGESVVNRSVLCPQQVTPGPSTTGQDDIGKVPAIVGVTRCCRSLDMGLSISGNGDIPQPVRKLLTDKPIQVVLQSVTKYVDQLGRDCNKSPLFNVVRRKLAVQRLGFVLYCVPNHSLRTYGNIEMGEGGLQVVFAISCKNNLSDVSVPPFNVTDCLSILQHGYCT